MSSSSNSATTLHPCLLDTSHTPSPSANEISQEETKKRPPQRRNNAGQHAETHDEPSGEGRHTGTGFRGQQRSWRRPPRRQNGPRGDPRVIGRNELQVDSPDQSGSSSISASSRAQRGRGGDSSQGHSRAPRGTARGGPPAPRGGGRRKKINAKLTTTDAEKTSDNSSTTVPVRHGRAVAKPDTLTHRLIEALRTPPYADCPICFNAIHPAQPIWSCSPSGPFTSSPNSSPSDPDAGDTQCCYTPFHLKCIKSWASKSVKDMRDAYLARGATGKQGEWRCPGCQHKRLHVPSSYVCFCGSMPDPRPPRLATPHSCGNPCSRPRACGHACSLPCHPGPCPSCQVTMQQPCYCDRQVKSFRCSELVALQANRSGTIISGLSCGNTCNRLLGCGKHRCPKTCHAGSCDECPIVEEVKCYCGKLSKLLRCGEGEEKHSSVVNCVGVLEEWDGKFACEDTCGRPFECNIHACEKPCHPPSASPPPCPRSPAIVSHCPCRKKRLQELEGGARRKCTDPIPTCGNLCMKKLELCEHVCSVPCHTGLCPPCGISLVIPCRCGSTTHTIKCYESRTSNIQEILCDKPCTTLRACGRHRCNRHCCPLAVLAGSAKGKSKKLQTQLNQSFEYVLGEEAHWHECDLICGKTLGCGNHCCEERDHRGACPPCLRSSFDEMICYCGRTVVEPPIPCGTRISCSYQCSRPPPPCSHPRTQHTCHEDPMPCPPCPFLTTKTCACGKNQIKNVRCSQEKVSCGTACGKLLDCGFHHCEQSCHAGGCETCRSICSKPRKLCLPAHHGCAAPCHAPAACSEDEPCKATVTLLCPCGRLQQSSVCGRSTANPAGREATQQLKCNNDCSIAKRNARLAEALGISQQVQEGNGQRPVTYSSDLIAFAHANAKFCSVLEKTFADFVISERKAQILPHMHEARRKFLQDLAAIYRMDTQLVDQEPMRSVQLIRRIDTRVPKPLLSSQATPTLNLGKLSDSHIVTHAPISRPGSASGSRPPPLAQNANRGWTSVAVANVTSATRTSSSSITASAWDTPARSSVVGQARIANPVHLRTSAVEPAAASRFLSPGVPVSGAQTTSTQQSDDSVPENWENDI